MYKIIFLPQRYVNIQTVYKWKGLDYYYYYYYYIYLTAIGFYPGGSSTTRTPQTSNTLMCVPGQTVIQVSVEEREEKSH
jgi:hypothetical protein